MTKTMTARWVKGVLVSAAAAAVCYWIWTSAREWAQDARAAPDSNFGTGFLEGLLAQIAGVASMPVLLWAAMRAVRERGNHLLVLGGAVAWLFIGGHIIEDAGVGSTETILYLTLFAAVGGVLAGVQPRSE
ncbi:hypothetical protein KQY30_19565 [Streptomyces sp. GMY02]|uniref:hypothetical protein n=1 Tax=Streptomyces sp. GMY02 TaxID=1333528 RepID=UPI001C2C58CE|nr:hypothetical protein [Streptomyces sp. GMY02]QXE36108.1 hypothetical protein KQY30_19565 [Streptomyces sp. GMY02]